MLHRTSREFDSDRNRVRSNGRKFAGIEPTHFYAAVYIVVPLAEVLATTYQRGRYARLIKYHKPMELPLSDEYRPWVRQRVATVARE